MQNEVKSEQPVDNSTTDISVQLQEVDALISATRRELSSSSLIGFTDTYLSHLMESKRPEFHREIMSRLENPTARELFIAPRGFAKSTICSRFYPLWLACYGKKKDIFLVSATISLAKENLRIIRQELENNEKLIADFGDLKSDKWTEEQLVLRNGTIIRAKGREFQIRGFRPDVILCDDLEDEELVYSKDQREKLESWFPLGFSNNVTIVFRVSNVPSVLHGEDIF